MTGPLMEVHSVCPRGSSLSTGLPTLTRRSTSQVKILEILIQSAVSQPTLAERCMTRKECYSATTFIDGVRSCDAFHARDEHASLSASNQRLPMAVEEGSWDVGKNVERSGKRG